MSWFQVIKSKLFPIPPEELSLRLVRKHGLSPIQVYPTGKALSASFIAKGIAPHLKLDKSTPIASMGSCFAREIKNELVRRGYNYVQTEHTPESAHASCAWERVYSAANAVEILNYTLSGEISGWRLARVGNEWRDLARNRIAYATKEQGLADMQSHCKASQTAIRTAEVFIFTVGQNETWQNPKGNYWFAQKPPAHFPVEEKQLIRGTVQSNLAQLETMYSLLKLINPQINLVLSLSPVPSTATFFERNVVVRSMANKAILRVAVESFVEQHPEVTYFPSYEIAMTYRGQAFEEDNIHVTKALVADIMNAFFEHHGSSQQN